MGQCAVSKEIDCMPSQQLDKLQVLSSKRAQTVQHNLEDLSDDMKALEEAVEGLIAVLGSRLDAMARLTSAALLPLGFNQLAPDVRCEDFLERRLLHEAIKSCLFNWLNDYVWRVPANWIKDDLSKAPTGDFNQLWLDFDKQFSHRVPGIASLMAYDLQLLQGPGNPSPDDVEMSLGTDGLKALMALVEASMRGWLRMKAVSTSYRVLVSGCRHYAVLAELEGGTKHFLRGTVEPLPPFSWTVLPPGATGHVLLTCKPGVVVAGQDSFAARHGDQGQLRQGAVVQEEVVATLVDVDLQGMM